MNLNVAARLRAATLCMVIRVFGRFEVAGPGGEDEDAADCVGGAGCVGGELVVWVAALTVIANGCTASGETPLLALSVNG